MPRKLVKLVTFIYTSIFIYTFVTDVFKGQPTMFINLIHNLYFCVIWYMEDETCKNIIIKLQKCFEVY